MFIKKCWYYRRQAILKVKFSDLISKYAIKASGTDKRIVNLIELKVIERQYHTLFDWKAKQHKCILEAFGEETKIVFENK